MPIFQSRLNLGRYFYVNSNTDATGLKAIISYLTVLRVQGAAAYGLFDLECFRQLISSLKKCTSDDEEQSLLLAKALQCLATCIEVHPFRNEEDLLLYLMSALTELSVRNVQKGIDSKYAKHKFHVSDNAARHMRFLTIFLRRCAVSSTEK